MFLKLIFLSLFGLEIWLKNILVGLVSKWVCFDWGIYIKNVNNMVKWIYYEI